uniref:Uncharacterized protein n=1 Tax=Timema genevievae TaxID=629358 RepID=A0A7R9PHW0_TIMGE|nr:unnamed protein product [Timema genevievae]
MTSTELSKTFDKLTACFAAYRLAATVVTDGGLKFVIWELVEPRLVTPLVEGERCAHRQSSAEFESSEQVDSFVLDLCTMLMSVKNVGIISRAPSYCPQLFQHPVLLHDALTSHLQTAGCTLVMGTSFHDVNMGFRKSCRGVRDNGILEGREIGPEREGVRKEGDGSPNGTECKGIGRMDGSLNVSECEDGTNASSDCSATITQVSSKPLAIRAVFEGLASIMFK